MATTSYLKPGIGNSPSYQVSAIPWVSSSIAPASGSSVVTFSFPQVTRFFTVKNVNPIDAPLRVGFSVNGVVNGDNYFILAAGESYSGELKIVDLHFMGHGSDPVAFSVIAGLTNIDRVELINNWSGSSGIG